MITAMLTLIQGVHNVRVTTVTCNFINAVERKNLKKNYLLHLEKFKLFFVLKIGNNSPWAGKSSMLPINAFQ